MNPRAVRLVEAVVRAANSHPDVRENFSPAGLFKAEGRGQQKSSIQNGSAEKVQLQKDHNDHIHLSRQP